MVKWEKVKLPPPSDTIYIMPKGGGSEVYFGGEKSLVANSTVHEILDAIKSIESTPLRLTKKDIGMVLNRFSKENV
jgi:hypothetical protein